MKAWVLEDIGNIKYKEVLKPQILENEVLVQVKAAGICGSDIPRIYQTGAHQMPLIPGHEFSGQVVQTGENADVKWQNKRVGIFPLIPCRNCIACQKGQYELCRNYSYLGSRRDGGFAEYVAVPERNLIELPENVSYEEAAMLEPMSVACHALRRVKASSSDTVAVCGLGTIGMFIVMLLLERNVKNLLVIGNKAFQKEKILKLGIKEKQYCDSKCENAEVWLDKKTGGIGADVFFECVGKNETCSLAINHAAPGGKVCLVGNPYSDMLLDKQVYWKILRNQLTVTGTWNSSFTGEVTDDWHMIVHLLKEKKIDPAQFISHRYTLEELNRGFEIMRDKSEDYIKIMAVME